MKLCCPNETLEWLGLHLEVPRDWQIVRHGLSKKLGTLRFTDRYSERLTFNWRTLGREPDLARMVAEQRHKDEQAHADGRIESVGLKGWQGYRVIDRERTWVRVVRFEPSSSQLWDVALTVKTGYEGAAPVSEQLVSRIAVTQADEGKARLCAFDLDATYPQELTMTKADVVPASVSVEFERQKDGVSTRPAATAFVKRFGMASSWYRDNPMSLAMRENHGVEFAQSEECDQGGHRALLVEGDTTRTRVQRWLGRTTKCRALVWHCETENAVYVVATRSDERAVLSPLSFSLRCCKAHDAAREPD